MTATTNIDDLLNGASLRAVLHTGGQTETPDFIQSFELPHITLIGDRFFAKTANRHAVSLQRKDYDPKTAFSHAYSNHYDFVVESNHADGHSCIFRNSIYNGVSFVTVQNYEQIWDSEKNQSVKRVESATLSGRRLKTALLDEEDIWNIHPIHMPSFYVDKNYFELFTEQDSMPEYFRQPKELEKISRQRQSHKEIGMAKPETVFCSNYYTIRSQGKYLHGKIIISQEEPQSYKSLRVFAEA